MSSPAPLWISEAEVVSMMHLGEAIEALEKGLLTEAHCDAANMMKTHVAWGNGSTLHAIGASGAAPHVVRAALLCADREFTR